jgi:hypothetical protein
VAYTIKALDETTWEAFAALVERNNGVFGGCWCIGFHSEGADKQTTPALNRRGQSLRDCPPSEARSGSAGTRFPGRSDV